MIEIPRRAGVVVHNIIEQMRASEFTFYLTGSQAQYGHGNDWDFFTDFDSRVIEFLKDLDFELEKSTEYKDTQTVEVWRHRIGIHVQLVSNPTMKCKLQAILFDSGMPTIEKSIVRFIWNVVANAYYTGRCENESA